MRPITVRNSLVKWHKMVMENDMSTIERILHPEVSFRSPASEIFYRGTDALALLIRTGTELFENFEYHREFSTEDGMSVTHEFSARTGQQSLSGIDLIRFDKNGLITEFELMIAPVSGLIEVARKMQGLIGDQMKKYADAVCVSTSLNHESSFDC